MWSGSAAYGGRRSNGNRVIGAIGDTGRGVDEAIARSRSENLCRIEIEAAIICIHGGSQQATTAAEGVGDKRSVHKHVHYDECGVKLVKSFAGPKCKISQYNTGLDHQNNLKIKGGRWSV